MKILISYFLVLLLLFAGCSDREYESANIHLKYGNPSKANLKNSKNYLLEKPQYALSYNCKTNTANWVSWQLDRSWLGRTERSDNFRPDADIPEGCYAVRPNDYRGSGYDRGHLAPSGDRTRRKSDNSATFVMSNMIPQAPENNREVWRELEEYSRSLAFEGKKLYIVAGGEGNKQKIAEGKIVVPKYTWKVILILDNGDVENTIAVWIPNSEAVANRNWQDYIVAVDTVEKKTGYNFFSLLDRDTQKKLEEKKYQQI